LISIQKDPISPQYHIGKAFKLSRHVVVASACWYYDAILGFTCTLGSLVQGGAHPNHVEKTSKIPKDILLLCNHLRKSVWASIGGPIYIKFKFILDFRNNPHEIESQVAYRPIFHVLPMHGKVI
jgi:hypothetical protein